MTTAEARDLAWQVGGDLAGLIGLVVVLLVGLAVLAEITR